MPDGAISFPILGDFYINPTKYFAIGSLKIHWYGVIIACGFLLAVMYACKRAPEFGLTSDNILDAVIYGLPAAIICGRAYYVIFYWSLYKDNLSEIIKLWHGGIAMYGVIIGAVLTTVVYTKRHKISLLALLDVVSLGFLIGQFIGRWGNFINREAFGYETTLPWKMGLTYDGVTTYVHPTFLYESLWNFVGFILIHLFSKKHRKFDGEIFAMYLGWYGFGRMFIEGLRTDSLYLFGTGIRVSQLLAFVTFLIAVCYILITRFKIKPAPEKMFVNRVKLQENEADAEEAAETSETVDETEDTETTETTESTETEEINDTVNSEPESTDDDTSGQA